VLLNHLIRQEMAEISPLRRRMIDDMMIRNLSPATQQPYLYAVAKFSRHFGRSPDRLGLEEVRAYQLHLIGRKAALSRRNQLAWIARHAAVSRLFLRTIAGRLGLSSPVLSDLLDDQAPGRKRSEQVGLRSGSGRVKSSHGSQSARSRTTICRLWISATSGPGSVVSNVNASRAPSGIGRHRPAKQNQSSSAFVNFHFNFGGLAPVNSKKCEAGIRERPFGKTMAAPAAACQPEMPLQVPPPRTSRFGSPLVLSRVHWVRPELVAEVTFLSWTDENLLRQVVYQGLREDKPAAEVRRPVPHAKPVFIRSPR
jgi:Phage integrase, N-terminal SAM-like domain/ATP dependent DNA ligase C terminal region